jgi:hypothetical protein
VNNERLSVDKKPLLARSGRLSRHTKRLLRDIGRHVETTKPTVVRSMTLPSTKRPLHRDSG